MVTEEQLACYYWPQCYKEHWNPDNVQSLKAQIDYLLWWHSTTAAFNVSSNDIDYYSRILPSVAREVDIAGAPCPVVVAKVAGSLHFALAFNSPEEKTLWLLKNS